MDDNETAPAIGTDTDAPADDGEVVFPPGMSRPAHRRWALVRNGFVAELRASLDHIRHPFKEVGENERVIDVTGVETVHVGYIVDAKGNVANSHGRTEPLTADEPAYHMAQTVPPVATINLQRHLESSGVEPIGAGAVKETPHASVEDGKAGVEQRRPDAENT